MLLVKNHSSNTYSINCKKGSPKQIIPGKNVINENEIIFDELKALEKLGEISIKAFSNVPVKEDFIQAKEDFIQAKDKDSKKVIENEIDSGDQEEVLTGSNKKLKTRKNN